MVEECSLGVDGEVSYLKRCSVLKRGMILSIMGHDK